MWQSCMIDMTSCVINIIHIRGRYYNDNCRCSGQLLGDGIVYIGMTIENEVTSLSMFMSHDVYLTT